MAVMKLCSARGCDEIALPGTPRCEEHESDRQKVEAVRRQAAKAGSRQWTHLYQSSFWRHGRADHLAREPLCRDCAGFGLVVPATEVDHIIPHRGNMKLFRDRKNWQSLCTPCHSRKTLREIRERGGEGKTQRPTP